MLIESFLFSVIENDDANVLFKVKDTFVAPKERPYIDFVKDFYANYKKLPDLTTVEAKFNIQLQDNTEKPDYWYKEIVDKYQEYVIEQAVLGSAKNKKKAIDIMQQAIVDYNVDVDAQIIDYADGKKRAKSYDARKGSGGITYLSTGNADLDMFSSGYKRADLWTIGGREGAGKAEPLSNKILTHNRGLISFGELTLQDKVYGSDGFPQSITGIFPQGVRPVMKIAFADNTEVYCDEEHLWNCENRYDREKGTGFVTRTTKQIKEDLVRNPKMYYKIPNTPPIRFEEKELPMHPYLLGVLLGDGCMSSRDVSITNNDKEILDRVKLLWGNCSTLNRSRPTDAHGLRLKGANEVIRSLGLFSKNSFSKFIPKDYLLGSKQQRLSILQGLMDTDGWVGRNGSTAEFSVRSEQLCKDVTLLARQLGAVAMPYIKMAKEEPMFSVRMSFPKEHFNNVFWLKRKADKFKHRSNVANFGKTIRSIEYSHDEECQCISVANSDRLYLTGENGIVTHNTWFLLRQAIWLDEYLIDKGISKPILIVSGEMDAEELEERIDAIKCEISYSRLSKGDLTPSEERRYKRFLQGVDTNIKIVDTFDNLKDVEYFMTIYRPAMTFIDGSHLLSSSYDWGEIAKVTSGMKRLTRNMKIPIVNTTHLKSEKGTSAKGGNMDDFAYTKGYTRDSDIVGVMFASDMMEIENKVGIDWVKIRRGSRTQLIWENDYETCKTELIDSKVGSQIVASSSGANSSTGSKRGNANGGAVDLDY